MRAVLARLGVPDYVLDRSLCSLPAGANVARQAGLPLPCEDREESEMRPARIGSEMPVAAICLPPYTWHFARRLP